ncbi:hypothetical protein OQA88_9011 [Cercophora sp. LCS_1]
MGNKTSTDAIAQLTRLACSNSESTPATCGVFNGMLVLSILFVFLIAVYLVSRFFNFLRYILITRHLRKEHQEQDIELQIELEAEPLPENARSAYAPSADSTWTWWIKYPSPAAAR